MLAVGGSADGDSVSFSSICASSSSFFFSGSTVIKWAREAGASYGPGGVAFWFYFVFDVVVVVVVVAVNSFASSPINGR